MVPPTLIFLVFVQLVGRQSFAQSSNVCAYYPPRSECDYSCDGQCRNFRCTQAQVVVQEIHEIGSSWWNTQRVSLPLYFVIPNDSCYNPNGQVMVRDLPVSYSGNNISIASVQIPHNSARMTYPRCYEVAPTSNGIPCTSSTTSTTVTTTTVTSTTIGAPTTTIAPTSTTTSTTTTTTTLPPEPTPTCLNSQIRLGGACGNGGHPINWNYVCTGANLANYTWSCASPSGTVIVGCPDHELEELSCGVSTCTGSAIWVVTTTMSGPDSSCDFGGGHGLASLNGRACTPGEANRSGVGGNHAGEASMCTNYLAVCTCQ